MNTYSFIPWDQCWDRKVEVSVPDRGTFNAYVCDNDSEYVVVCVHGAGHSALSFSRYAQALKPKCASGRWTSSAMETHLETS